MWSRKFDLCESEDATLMKYQVYCNHCYQNRGHSVKTPASVNFPEILKPGKSRATKVLTCAVDDCDSDVKAKDKWVGVFL